MPPADLPLFPLGLVALPGEFVPLHIFEERYRAMVHHCLEGEEEFGILWAEDGETRAVGCACAIERLLEELDDGRMNILARGTRPFRVLERREDLPYPAGTVEFLADRREEPEPDAAQEARELYAELVEEATDEPPQADELARMSAYDMAATVEFGLQSKQDLLELRSETARMRMLARLLREATARLEAVSRAQEQARSNGKVRFG